MPPAKQKKLHKCDKCIRTYTNVGALEAHKKSMHATRTEMAVKPQERFMCAVCKTNFPSRFVVMKHMEVYHAKWVSKGFRPVPLHECSVCKLKNVDLTVHDCSTDKRYLSITTDSIKTKMNPLFCASSSCSDAFNSPKKFDFHVQVRHNKNMEVMFFPDMTEFCRWKADLEKSISVQFTESSEETNGRKFYSCVNTKVTKLFIERCPATIVVQKFTKGFLVKYYTEHNRHNVTEYKITKRDQKYRITDYLPPIDDESGYDPYLDFKTLLDNIVLGAAKININGLKELVGRALEMTVILNTYDQEKKSTKFTQIIEHMTDDEITKVLLKDPGIVTLKRVSLNPHISEPPNKKAQPDMAPKIINTFSLAENPLANTSDTDSMDENDIDDKILISNMLDKPKRPIYDTVNAKLDELKDKEFVSFNESYRDFVRRNRDFPPCNLRSSKHKNNTKSNSPATKNTDIRPVSTNNKSTANSNQNQVGPINTVSTIPSIKQSANVSMPVSNAGGAPPTQNLLTNNIVLVALPPNISNNLVDTNIGGVNVPAVDITNYSITTSAVSVDVKNSNATTNNGSHQNPPTPSALPTQLGGVKKPNILVKKTVNKKTKRNTLNRKSKAKVKSEDRTSPIKAKIADDAEEITIKEEINISRHESDTDAKFETDTEKSCTNYKNIIKKESDGERDSDTDGRLQEFDKNKRKSREKLHVKLSPKKVDIEYKVIEQDSDCNILVLKL